MDQKETKINVIAKDGEVKVLTGSDFHILQDQTRVTYLTDNVDDFISYVNNPNIINGPCAVYYRETGAECISDMTLHDEVPLAKLSLKNSRYVDTLAALNKRLFTPDDLEDTLAVLRVFGDTNAINLFNITRNLTIQKVLEVKRSKDNRGNYSHSLKFESGVEDLNLPGEVSFWVPLFVGLDTKGTFSFEPTFEVSVKDEGKPTIGFRLTNYQFEDQLFQNRLAVLSDKFSALKSPKYWGTLQISQSTDAWKYLHKT